jgi:signal transduction histidine kinase
VIAKQLEVEIASQRVLRLAESKQLRVNINKERVSEIFSKLKWFFEPQMSYAKRLRFDIGDKDEEIDTDFALLNRILSNMIKNAVEASEDGQTVSIKFYRKKGAPVFEVHNETVIPDDVAVQIFNRSFSTKNGIGRGLGTYSMKLFGENYLEGKVSFVTSAENGTSFFITLPKEYK